MNEQDYTPLKPLAATPCRSDNVPLHAPADWADEMRAVIQRIEDGDEDEAPAVSPSVVVSADRATLLREAADELGRMDYDADSSDYGYDTYRDAWNGGVMDAAEVLRRVAAEEQPAETQDSLPAWLYQRFMSAGAGWENLDADDRSYWEHQARAVRRAVTRGGFKADAERPAATEQPDTQTREAQRCPAKHGALGRICKLPLGHTGMHTGSGPNGGAVWDGDAP